MSDIAVQLDSQVGNAECEWCSATYTKIVYNSKYCSDDCRREVQQANAVGRYHREYPPTKYTANGLFYQDYVNENDRAIEKYGVKPPTPKEGRKGKRYKVPEMKFKRFRETKNVMVLEQKIEAKRNGWV